MKKKISINGGQDKFTLSSDSYLYEPEDSFETVNKYGTYEIQPTSATENAFPKIAQSLAKEKNRKVKQSGSSEWEDGKSGDN